MFAYFGSTELSTFFRGRRYRAFAFTFGVLMMSFLPSNAFHQSTLPLTLGRHACKRARQSQGVHVTLAQQQPFVRTACALFSTAAESPRLTHPRNLDDGNRRHGSSGMPVGAIQIEASCIQPFKDLIHRVMREDVTLQSRNISKMNLAFRGVEKFVGPSTLDQAKAGQEAAHASAGSIAGIERKRRKQLLVHLPTVVASALDDGHPELTNFLQTNHVTYLPGLRRHRSHPEATRARRHAMRSAYVAPKPSQDANLIDLPPTFTYTELFAGIGGFRLGLDAIGGKCVFANEIDTYAAAIYRRNFSMNGYDPNCPLVEADILDLCPSRDAIPKDVDILCAGFPCQSFSVRGDQLALNDDRGQLYRELCRMLLSTTPKSFIFENVLGLVTMEGGYAGRDGHQSKLRAGKVFNHVLSAFKKCGYTLTWNVVNAANFLPQRRKRVYITGIRNDITATFNWDWYDDIVSDSKKKDSRVLRDVLEAKDVSDAYHLTISQIEKARRIHGKAFYQRAILDIQEKAPTLISSYRKSNSMTTKYIMEEADGTIGGVPVFRYLTPREVSRLQGFPEWTAVPSAGDSETDHAHFYKGIGNAVCPPLIERIGQELVQCIESS